MGMLKNFAIAGTLLARAITPAPASAQASCPNDSDPSARLSSHVSLPGYGVVPYILEADGGHFLGKAPSIGSNGKPDGTGNIMIDGKITPDEKGEPKVGIGAIIITTGDTFLRIFPGDASADRKTLYTSNDPAFKSLPEDKRTAIVNGDIAAIEGDAAKAFKDFRDRCDPPSDAPPPPPSAPLPPPPPGSATTQALNSEKGGRPGSIKMVTHSFVLEASPDKPAMVQFRELGKKGSKPQLITVTLDREKMGAHAPSGHEQAAIVDINSEIARLSPATQGTVWGNDFQSVAVEKGLWRVEIDIAHGTMKQFYTRDPNIHGELAYSKADGWQVKIIGPNGKELPPNQQDQQTALKLAGDSLEIAAKDARNLEQKPLAKALGKLAETLHL